MGPCPAAANICADRVGYRGAGLRPDGPSVTTALVIVITNGLEGLKAEGACASSRLGGVNAGADRIVLNRFWLTMRREAVERRTSDRPIFSAGTAGACGECVFYYHASRTT